MSVTSVGLLDPSQPSHLKELSFPLMAMYVRKDENGTKTEAYGMVVLFSDPKTGTVIIPASCGRNDCIDQIGYNAPGWTHIADSRYWWILPPQATITLTQGEIYKS